MLGKCTYTYDKLLYFSYCVLLFNTDHGLSLYNLVLELVGTDETK